MTIALSANTPRVSYTVSQGATQTSFAVPFVFFTASTDLNVFVDNVARTFDASTSNTSLFTVSGGNGSTGTVTTSVTGATGGSTVVITRAIPLSRTTDFPSSGAFEISKLNTELDTVTAIQSDFNDSASRAIRLQDSDSAVSMELPLLASRKGTVLGFNATTGAAEAGPTITAVQSLADVTASINLLGTSAVVTDMGLLATSANITAMGILGTSANVTAMGLLGTSDVIADMALLGTSDVVADMALLATTDVIADMNTLATSDIISDLNTLATSDIVTDMNLLATSDNVTAMGVLGTSANVTAMGLLGTSSVVEDMGFLGTSANVTAMGLLGTSANVTAMGLLGTSAVVTDMSLLGTSAVVTDMDILATSANVTNMATLGASGVVGNIATVAGVASNVTTVANNISGVNSFAERYRVQSGVPSSDNDVGDLVFDTAANTLKVFGSSGFQNAGSSVNGTSDRFTYNITGTPTTLTGASGTGFAEAGGKTLAYDAGFLDVYLNGVKMVNGTDVTVTSGDSVVFASALSNGDVVDIVTFGTFSLASINASNLSSGTVPVARVSGSYTGITGTGALNAGSITSGFGNIDTGSSTITTTGAVTVGALSAKGGAVFNEDSADVDFRVESNGEANMLFVDGGNDRVVMSKSSSGASTFPLVLTNPPDNNANTAVGLRLVPSNATIGDRTVDIVGSQSSSGGNAMELKFLISNGGTSAERMRIDSSGNLLVGTTSNDSANLGARMKSTGRVDATADGGVASLMTRLSSDGNIMGFKRGSTTVGVIGSAGGSTEIFFCGSDSNTAGIYMANSARIIPMLNSVVSDNSVDMGHPSFRFDDVFATNGTIQTSDKNEKQDIEELSDAEKRVAVVAKGLMRKFRWKDAVAEKGDKARTHFGIIAQDLEDAFKAEGLDASKYAMFCSDTWWEKEITVEAVEADEEKGIEAQEAYTRRDVKEEATEGYTEKTRLGVRYSELLAFIISAI